MKRHWTQALAMMGAVIAPSLACAQSGDVTGSVGVTGYVTAVCEIGTLPNDSGIFNVGILVDTSTGYLLQNLSVPPKTLTGSYCNTKSFITIGATPMLAQSYSGNPPNGFSKSVDYSATASGWTDTPAMYLTSSASNPDQTQTRPTPFAGDIEVSLSGFTTTGGNNLRLVGDPLYQGVITVTISVAS